jgi:multiple sugar transport system ATP-binding protein
MATVTLDNVGKRYASGHAFAVDDVNLAVADGEFFVLLGPSGCGKSTTLRMIAGLESITSGIVSIDGKPMNQVPAKDRDIAMVFQSYALYPHMSVRENLAFGLRRRRMPRAEIERRVNDAARALGLLPLLERKPYALSGGQRQRVALGRAIVRQPKVFLFDEPLSNLDAALRVGMRGELGRLHQELRTTMIYVTHDQVEAMTMGDRICIMHEGHVVQIGPPLDVYLRPANTFVATFLGAPPMNIAPVVLTPDRHACTFGAAAVPLAGPVRDAASRATQPELLLGVRPENVTIGPDASDIAAQAVLVEPLGAETIVRLSVPGWSGEMMMRMPGVPRMASGERVNIKFDPQHLHLFDPQSTLRL